MLTWIPVHETTMRRPGSNSVPCNQHLSSPRHWRTWKSEERVMQYKGQISLNHFETGQTDTCATQGQK